MRPPVRLALLLAHASALAACGGGGVATEFSTHNGGSSTSGGFVLETRSAVVASDVDGDGLADLVALTRDGAGVGGCWRNTGRSGWVESAALRDAAGTLAIHEDAASRSDADLAEGIACHVAATRGARRSAYAVVRLGDGAPGTVAGAPAIDSLEPSSGPVRSLLVIEGRGLASSSEAPSVSMGGVAATVLFSFEDALIAVVPEGLAAGPAAVRVTRGGIESAPATFTVTEGRTPVVTSVVPSRVQAGQHAVIRGHDLGGPLDDVQVAFAGVVATTVIPLFEALVVEVPAAAVSGSLVVTVGGRASEPFYVEVGAAPVPRIDRVTPSAASPGSLVEIEGADLFRLESSTIVTFGGTRAAVFGVGDGRMTVIVPTGASDGDVVVTTASLASAGFAFDVTTRAAPRIDSISPSAATGGELVRIDGTDLVDLSAWQPGRLPPIPLFGDLRVTVGGADAWFVLPSATGLEVLVPFGAATGAVVVTVGGQPSNAVAFARN